MKRWRRSGLSAREYASSAGLSAATLYGWSSRLGRDATTAPARFIEVTPTTTPRSIELRIGPTVTVLVEPGFDPQLLRDVVAALVAP